MIKSISKENYKKTLKILEGEIKNKTDNLQGTPLTMKNEVKKINHCIAFVKLVYSKLEEVESQKTLF